MQDSIERGEDARMNIFKYFCAESSDKHANVVELASTSDLLCILIV